MQNMLALALLVLLPASANAFEARAGFCHASNGKSPQTTLMSPVFSSEDWRVTEQRWYRFLQNRPGVQFSSSVGCWWSDNKFDSAAEASRQRGQNVQFYQGYNGRIEEISWTGNTP